MNDAKIPRPIRTRLESASPNLQKQLVELRSMIVSVAREPEIGGVEETLKWNAPAYIARSGKGTTLRLEHDSQIHLRVHCQSKVVERFKTEMGNVFAYDGSRGISLRPEDSLKDKKVIQGLKRFIRLALTYHSWK
ncbi:MAG: hypothetical protein CMN76_13925 [Spirochaetaceae bacterium]|nr:hypothetical protein [Spirochaetaceae bacterium]